MIRTGRVYTCHQGYQARVQDERGVQSRESKAAAIDALEDVMEDVGDGKGLSYNEQEVVGKSRRSTTRPVGERWTLRA